MTTRVFADQRLEAGYRALTQGDWRGARDIFAVAVDGPEPAEARLGLGTAHWCGYEIAPAIAELKAAHIAFVAEGKPARAAFVAAWLGFEEAAVLGNDSVARGWLRRAERLLDGTGPCVEQGWFRLWSAMFEGDPERLVEASRLALDLARAERDGDLEAVALSQIGIGLVLCGDVAEGMGSLDECLVGIISGEVTAPVALFDCFCALLTSCELASDYGRAEEWCRMALEVAAERGVATMAATCRVTYGWLLGVLGRPGEAEAELTQAIRTFETGSHRQLRLDALARLADLRRRQLRLEEASRLLRDAAGSSETERVEAELALDTGDPQKALAIARKLMRRVPSGRVTLRVPALALLVRAAAASGELDEARTALAELMPAASSVGTSATLASLWVARAALAEAEGAPQDEAEGAYWEAIHLYTRSGAVFETAQARLRLADLLGRSGRQAEAAREANLAKSALARLRSSSVEPSLSRRELDVLRLVTGGLSNSAIAERLNLSPHTVHRHVASLLRKLEVSNRAAAAAEAIRRQLV